MSDDDPAREVLPPLRTNAELAREIATFTAGLSPDEMLAHCARAQVFALLAVADALTAKGAGYNVAESILSAGGIQP